MKKIVFTALIIIVLLLTMFCKSAPKTADEQYDKQYKEVYDANIELDFTGASSYTVKKGDTLSDISRQAYNNGFYYPIIMLASQGVVINPDKIRPGMELTLPDLDRNKANVNSRQCMKNCLNEFAEIEKNKTKPNQPLIDGFMKYAEEL